MKIKKTALFMIILLLSVKGGAAPASDEKLQPTSVENQFIYPEFSKTISMDFKDAALIDVLKILSQQSGLNFISSQEVAGKRVTLFLNNVPVEEALERILTANGLTYEIASGSGIFIVKPLDKPAKNTITRIYKLKHASVSSSKINKTIDISSAIGSSESTAGGSGIIAALKSVLTPSGSIVEDPRTNSLIITDIAVQFSLIEQTLARLDVEVPQILIDVEMLDVSKNTADLIGIKFGSTPLTFKGGERSVLYPWDQNKLLRKGFTFAEEYRVGTVSAAGLQMTLQFLRTQSDTKNLARPRILTLNNETAEIKISTNEAIGLATQNSGSTGTTTQTKQAERVQTGIFLTVTPQANLLTGEITMAIVPRVIQARTGATFEGTTFKDAEERGSQSVLRVKDGDTIVLGGLVRSDSVGTVTKVPFLGDIPIIGRVFRHNDLAKTNRELIIFITPRIVKDEASFPAETKVSYQPLSRKQNIPTAKQKEINKAIFMIENQK